MDATKQIDSLQSRAEKVLRLHYLFAAYRRNEAAFLRIMAELRQRCAVDSLTKDPVLAANLREEQRLRAQWRGIVATLDAETATRLPIDPFHMQGAGL